MGKNLVPIKSLIISCLDYYIKKFHYDLSFSIFGFLYLENFNYDKSTKGNFWQFFSIHNDSSSSMVFGTPVEACPMLL